MENILSSDNLPSEIPKNDCEIKKTELNDSPPSIKKQKIDDENIEINQKDEIDQLENVLSSDNLPSENLKNECVMKKTELTDSLLPTRTSIEINQPDKTQDQSIIKENEPIMSKRQKKKLIRGAQWEITKKIKRLEEREKYKQKRLNALAKGQPTRIGPSRKELKRKQLNLNELCNEYNLKVAIDLDFEDLMSERDISKCVKQLLRIYTINRRSEEPSKLYFVGVKENDKIHKCLQKNDGYENWNVKWEFNKNYIDIFNHNEIIYLSSDSDNVLEKFDKNCIYIIGGIVDHNHHKGLCQERAQKLNIKTARLPLNEHVHIKTRTVLSTVHVFEMLLHVSAGKSWKETILDILPMRKGAKPLDDDNNQLPDDIEDKNDNIEDKNNDIEDKNDNIEDENDDVDSDERNLEICEDINDDNSQDEIENNEILNS